MFDIQSFKAGLATGAPSFFRNTLKNSNARIFFENRSAFSKKPRLFEKGVIRLRGKMPLKFRPLEMDDQGFRPLDERLRSSSFFFFRNT